MLGIGRMVLILCFVRDGFGLLGLLSKKGYGLGIGNGG
jgi:hypothetical protein